MIASPLPPVDLVTPPPRAPRPAAPDDDALRAAARDFEAAFLAEMLTHAGLGRTPEAFGGGAGEDAFAGMLVRERAEALAARGGIGLAEAIFAALARREGGA